MSATSRVMKWNKQARITNPSDFPLGILVDLTVEFVYVAAKADDYDLARGLEFVRWLVGTERWLPTVDGKDIGAIDDPCQLFSADLPDPESIDDPTIPPISKGKLVVWRIGSASGQGGSREKM